MYEETTFSSDPFEVLKLVIPVQLFFVIGVAILVSVVDSPVSTKSGRMSPGGFAFMIFLVNAAIAIGLAVGLSYKKKRLVVCTDDGCDITAANLWGNMGASQSFRWSEVTDTNLVLELIDRGRRHMALHVNVGHRDILLLGRTLLNRRKFDDLVEVVNRSTAHLPYALEKTADAGDRQVIEEIRDYSKVARQ